VAHHELALLLINRQNT